MPEGGSYGHPRDIGSKGCDTCHTCVDSSRIASVDALRKGARRTLALRSMNVRVISVAKDVVYDEQAFDALARIVAMALGSRVRKPAKSGEHQRNLLRQTHSTVPHWAAE